MQDDIRIEIDERWRVRASCDVALPLSAVALWGQMRDFPRFCAMDPLHRRVSMRARNGGTIAFAQRGAELVIPHRLFGFGPDRVGRILTWREGRGYAFSDLSRRGRTAGFPHVCSYRIQPIEDQRCVLTIGTRGVWTARFLPRWMIRWWLAFVLRATTTAVRREIVRFARWREAQARGLSSRTETDSSAAGR